MKSNLRVVDQPDLRDQLGRLIEYVQALAEHGDVEFNNEAAALHGAIVGDLLQLGLDRCANAEAEGVLMLTTLKTLGVVSLGE